jgi:hypothetical protein
LNKLELIIYVVVRYNGSYFIALQKDGSGFKNPSGDFHTAPAPVKPDLGGECVVIKEGALWLSSCDTPAYYACENVYELLSYDAFDNSFNCLTYL